MAILNVTSTAAQLQILNVGMTANNCFLNGVGGTPGDPFSVLTVTNAALPKSGWKVLPAGVFDSTGRFGFTNGVTPGVPVQFYSIRVP